MKRVEYLLLLLILIGAFSVRLYRFGSPVADWHSWRQADTSAVSRNFINHGFDVLHPKFDDLSNVPSGLDNPNGYRFVEFPIYNVFQAGLYQLIGIFTLEEWGRLVNIFSAVLSTLFIYLLVRKYANNLAALLAAFFFALLPFNIYFGRTILPDPMMVMAILGGTFFFDLWLDKSGLRNLKSETNSKFKIQNSKLQFKVQNCLFFILSIIFTASSFLLKPYALFFTLPMIYLAWKAFGFKALIKWQLWIFAIITISPLIFWRFWILQYPEGIPASGWLFNGGNIRFKPSFFYWIFADRIGREILGYWGLPVFVFGILSLGAKFKEYNLKKSGFLVSFLISSLLYLFIIARGNVQHDYYQILIIPAIAIFLGIGGEFLIKISKEYFSRIISYALFCICAVFMLFFGWYNVRNLFNLNYPIVSAGVAVDKLIPKDAKVIAINEGDTSFLYQTKRKGWASFEKDLPVMIKMGADYLILPNPKKPDFNIGKEYKIVSYSVDYILFDLNQKP
ncbi:MAG: glycosyltransferase family 39 protein [Candidatus Levybacteria bacterium]|nr:glycosyltransferase family 39 protein [Candidatus Levybacteria bacterium]